MRLPLPALLLLGLGAPTGAACILEYEDPAGDTDPPVPGAGYDIVAFQAVTRNGTMWWRVQAVGLEPTTSEVQYVGQIDTGEREGSGDGTAVLYHPICPLWIQRSALGLAPDCHLSRSHVVGNAVNFELVGPLEASIEAGGWLNVTVPYSMLQVEAGDELGDFRSTSQVAVTTPSPDGESGGTITPVVTDTAGSGEDLLMACPTDGGGGLAPNPEGKGPGGSGREVSGDRGPDGSDQQSPWPGLPALVAAVALTILVRRRAS